MNQENSPTLRLTIWRPAHLDRRLMYRDAAIQNGELHEEAYRWETTEDFLGSFDKTQSAVGREALFTAFATHLAPAQRSMAQLSAALQVLEAACAAAGNEAWKDGLTVESFGDGLINLRAHGGLVLYRHLRWVYDIFKDVPEASVTVR